MKTFQLRRFTDVSGVSGIGVIAEGVEFSNGRCVLSWLTAISSIEVTQCVEDLMKIHGHNGATVLEWSEPDVRS